MTIFTIKSILYSQTSFEAHNICSLTCFPLFYHLESFVQHSLRTLEPNSSSYSSLHPPSLETSVSTTMTHPTSCPLIHYPPCLQSSSSPIYFTSPYFGPYIVSCHSLEHFHMSNSNVLLSDQNFLLFQNTLTYFQYRYSFYCGKI